MFRSDPIIPPELSIYWDFQVYLRGEGERASSQGALYLTNVQQLYDRTTSNNDDEPDEMTGVIGPKPPTKKLEVVDFDQRLIARSGPVVVLNDEAHHTHDEESEWNKGIRRLHEQVLGGLVAQLDFTATPRHTKGALFTWTVYDYPLKQAIIDNIVKHPIKGIATGIDVTVTRRGDWPCRNQACRQAQAIQAVETKCSGRFGLPEQELGSSL